MKKRKKEGKSNGRLIVDALMTGKPLSSRDIGDMIFKSDGRKIKVQDISSLLSKISKEDKYELGHFIKKVKGNNGFTYQIVEEAMALTQDKAYDLILKTGKNRYTIEQALNEFPDLRKYVETGKSKVTSEKKVAEKSAKPKLKAEKSVVALPPRIKAPAKKENNPESSASVFEIPGGEDFLEKLAAGIIRKITELGGLNLNVKVSVKPDEES